MSCVDNHLGGQEIRPKFLNCKDNRKDLLLDGCVILLGLIKCLASITFDMRLLVSLLAQNHHNYVINSITHNFKGKTSIGLLNNGGGNKSLLDHVKKASRHSLEKMNRVSLAKSKVKGLAILKKSLMKHRQKPTCPRKLCTPFTQLGGGKRSITSIFALSPLPLFDTTWPKITSSCTMKWHFSQFRTKLTSSHLWRTLVKLSKHKSNVPHRPKIHPWKPPLCAEHNWKRW